MEKISHRSRGMIQCHDHLTIYVNNKVENKINDIPSEGLSGAGTGTGMIARAGTEAEVGGGGGGGTCR